ncbi:hypothetical protein GCM10010495_68920 [Kitasatospora herbaricolor]|nr:hypothetical protein GCM10010495_68920 [Kitasatospora herbaricolor]
MFITAAAPAKADWATLATTGWTATDGDGATGADVGEADRTTSGVATGGADEQPVARANAPTRVMVPAICPIFCMMADSSRSRSAPNRVGRP